jgi:hypothetical protein
VRLGRRTGVHAAGLLGVIVAGHPATTVPGSPTTALLRYLLGAVVLQFVRQLAAVPHHPS